MVLLLLSLTTRTIAYFGNAPLWLSFTRYYPSKFEANALKLQSSEREASVLTQRPSTGFYCLKRDIRAHKGRVERPTSSSTGRSVRKPASFRLLSFVAGEALNEVQCLEK